MNKFKITMSAMLLSSALVGCQNGSQKADEVIIEKPEIEIKDGRISPEVLAAFGRVSEAIVSPDKTKVAVAIGYESIEQNASNSEIHVMNIDGSDLQRLTRTAGSEFNLRWIDGGKRLAFLAKDNESGKVQLFTMNADGTDRKCVSKAENGMTCFEISPDQTKVIYGSLIKAFEKDEALFGDLPNTSGRYVTDLMYKHWDEWVEEIPHPFLADFNGSSVENAVDIMSDEPFECPMKPFGAAETFAWSPDSKKLVYTSRKVTGKDYAFSTNSDLYLYDLEAKTTVNLTEGMLGYDTNPHSRLDEHGNSGLRKRQKPSLSPRLHYRRKARPY